MLPGIDTLLEGAETILHGVAVTNPFPREVENKLNNCLVSEEFLYITAWKYSL